MLTLYVATRPGAIAGGPVISANTVWAWAPAEIWRRTARSTTIPAMVRAATISAPPPRQEEREGRRGDGRSRDRHESHVQGGALHDAGPSDRDPLRGGEGGELHRVRDRRLDRGMVPRRRCEDEGRRGGPPCGGDPKADLDGLVRGDEDPRQLEGRLGAPLPGQPGGPARARPA